MIRVLHVIRAMERAGAETFIMNVYRNIDTKSIQFDFLVNADNVCAYDHEIVERGGGIFRVPYFNVINYNSYVRSVKRFFSQHNEHPIVHGHVGLSAPVYLREARKLGKYTIAHSHGANAPLSVKELGYRIVSSQVRNTAEHFFACSKQAGLDRFGTQIVADSNLFEVINNGIDLEKYKLSQNMHAARKERLGLSSFQVFGHVGRFANEKNHAFLLRVFCEIKRINPRSVLLLVGDGPLRKPVEDEARQLGIIDSVFFIGIVPDPRIWLEAMDVFVFPSFHEGLSLALLEAQAAGLPCVVSEAIDSSNIASNRVCKLPLNDSPSFWASKCLGFAELRNEPNSDEIESLRMMGFDIRDTAKKMEEFYLSHA